MNDGGGAGRRLVNLTIEFEVLTNGLVGENVPPGPRMEGHVRDFVETGNPVHALSAARVAAENGLVLPAEVGDWIGSGIAAYTDGGEPTLDRALGLRLPRRNLRAEATALHKRRRFYHDVFVLTHTYHRLRRGGTRAPYFLDTEALELVYRRDHPACGDVDAWKLLHRGYRDERIRLEERHAEIGGPKGNLYAGTPNGLAADLAYLQSFDAGRLSMKAREKLERALADRRAALASVQIVS